MTAYRPYDRYRKHLGIESAPGGSGAMWLDADYPYLPSHNVFAIPPDTTQ